MSGRGLLCALLVLASAGTAAAETSAKDEVLRAFSELVGGRWTARGSWAGGRPFHQEQVFALGLGGRIVKVTTWDMDSADAKTGAIGLRNEGIRAWDEATGVMRFWEFDRFGGVTTGTCSVSGPRIVYEYEYRTPSGVEKLREVWTRVDRDRYDYRVGIFDGSQWTKILLETSFTRGRTTPD